MFLFVLILLIPTFCQSNFDKKEFHWKLPLGSASHESKADELLKINVAGETLFTTNSTLTYIPNTKLSLFRLWPRDEKGHLFFDFPPNLFKDFLSQLRRWSIRNNRSDDIRFEPPSWKVKDEFNEMIIALGFEKYQRIPPTQCIKYKLIDDFYYRADVTPNESYETNKTNKVSGWTRFVDQAGTIIIDYVPTGRNFRPCGYSWVFGWFFGVYPTRLYSTTIGKICYYGPQNAVPCDRTANGTISVTHCGDYFVFDIQITDNHPTICTIDRPMPS
ncbi:unnamed protein product [Adineta ricciae]|uniref:Uncharacterized protein n=1 Tax=Adineta ricciae TaxID=249248 RepID=A0A815HUU6_ADIRI|nr:unnamed protein product [Adineta ricciae]CAF1637476.1 unnamed protein product [Adineta ricciae]